MWLKYAIIIYMFKVTWESLPLYSVLCFQLHLHDFAYCSRNKYFSNSPPSKNDLYLVALVIHQGNHYWPVSHERFLKDMEDTNSCLNSRQYYEIRRLKKSLSRVLTFLHWTIYLSVSFKSESTVEQQPCTNVDADCLHPYNLLSIKYIVNTIPQQ